MRPILVNHKPTIEALVKFEREFSEEHGPFAFFGFVLTAYDDYLQSGNDWIVTASAPWSTSYKNSTREAFSKGISNILDIEEWWKRPRSRLLLPDDPDLDPLYEALEIQHDLVELIDVELFGKEVRRAYIITCQRLTPVAAEGQD